MHQKNFPTAPRQEHQQVIHQDVLDDPYAWLRDESAPETIMFVDQVKENYELRCQTLQPNIDILVQEICSRIQLDDTSVPIQVDNYSYWEKTNKDSDHEILLRQQDGHDNVETLLDINILARPFDYYDVGAYEVSPDHRYLAFTVDLIGDERYFLYIIDLKKQQTIVSRWTDVSSEFCWSKDSQLLYYIALDNRNRPAVVKYHRLNQPVWQDGVLYHEWDDAFFLGIGQSKDKQYVFLTASSNNTTECFYFDQSKPLQCQKTCGRHSGIRYYISHRAGIFYKLSNETHRNFAVCQTPSTDLHQWQTIVAGSDAVTIETIELMADYLVLETRENAQLKFRILDYQQNHDEVLVFDEEVYSIAIGENIDPHSNVLRYYYESMTNPGATYEICLQSKQKTCLKKEIVLGDFNSCDYSSERIYAKAKDGCEIPISLVYKKSNTKAPKPLYLYGYGAYGETLDPWFSHTRLSLLNRGFIFAIAHVRGGADCGEAWHEMGKMQYKSNSFTDLLTCMQTLVEQDYTTRELLTISGGSAGGLLVGATINLAPASCAYVVAEVPFVDVLNTMLDDTLPLTVGEYEEWGNPNIADEYFRIKSYCPYTNVTAGSYPDFYISIGMSDTRVPYWEGLKWAAKLKHYNPDIDIAVKCNDDAGHAGASGRFGAIREIAEQYAFILEKFKIEC